MEEWTLSEIAELEEYFNEMVELGEVFEDELPF